MRGLEHRLSSESLNQKIQSIVQASLKTAFGGSQSNLQLCWRLLASRPSTSRWAAAALSFRYCATLIRAAECSKFCAVSIKNARKLSVEPVDCRGRNCLGDKNEIPEEGSPK